MDPWGTDAIVITTSTTSVYCNVHTSVIAQDADGKWFYFYWGDKNCVVVEVPPDAMSDLDSFNSWLAENGAGKEGEGTDKLLHDSSSDYTTATYIEGDFTDSVDYYNEIVNDSNVTDNKNPAYGLLSFNCMHASYEGLKLGKLTNGDSFSDFAKFDGFGSVRPNDFRVMIRETFANQSFSKSDAYAQATGNVGKKKPFFQSKNYYNKGQKYGRILKGA